MPEIWLPYGSVEVVVSLKAENLAEQIEPKYSFIGEDSILETLRKIDAEGRTCIFSPKPSKASIDIMDRLIKELTSRGLEPTDITVSTDRRYVADIRKLIGEKQINISEIEAPTETLGKIDGKEVKIPKTLNDSKTRVVVTDAAFDPLFGFSGGPTTLIRHLGGNLMAEAFRRRKNDAPSPGVESDPAVFADEVARLLDDSVSIEVTAFGDGISSLYVGGLVDAHKAASKHLSDTSQVSIVDDMRAVIVSAGGFERDATLADGLKAVWNVTAGLRDKGFLTLVAECSGGLGSDALRMYTSGRLDVESLVRRGEYVDGLEDLVYIKTALHRSTPILVSTLPNYYIEMKMGFHACRKAGDALSYILSSLGAKTKVHILPHGSVTLLSKR